ncbi:hypothetical protein SUDANB1_05705 [Streptomyces sp. enrichment culture]|uniref:DNA-binding protein n=1 Tax=Streptomyces sp. enrichment culture TaxID=1795815 RepID=UPI003F578CD0
MTDKPAIDHRTLTVGDLLKLPPTTDVETAGRAFGMGRTKAYQLVRTGKFPCQVVECGAGYRVVTADLMRVLGVGQNTDTDHAPAA